MPRIPGGRAVVMVAVAATLTLAWSSGVASARAHADFCANVQQQITQSGDLVSQLTSSDPATLRRVVRKLRRANRAIVASAPDELKADITVLAKASEKIIRALEKANFDFSKLNAASVTKVVTTAKYRRAARHLLNYIKDKCGIDLSVPTTSG